MTGEPRVLDGVDEMRGVPALDRDGVERRAALEEQHWWFRGRRAVLDAALGRLSVPEPCEVLDLGAGTGRMLEPLSRFGSVTGVELNPKAVLWARAHGRDVREASAMRLPFEAERFGLISCLDVLEHLEDDGAVFREARRVVRADGILLATVPAYPRLFSGHDVAAGHVRRYSRRGLIAIAEANGWRAAYATHFNALLLPLAAAARLVDRARGGRAEPRSDLLRTPRFADRALLAPFAIEARLVARGVRLPAGLSILAAFQPR